MGRRQHEGGRQEDAAAAEGEEAGELILHFNTNCVILRILSQDEEHPGPISHLDLRKNKLIIIINNNKSVLLLT